MRRTLAAAIAVAALGACSGGGSAVINWDLSERRTLAEVGRERSGSFDDVESVRITFPDGSVFRASADIREVAVFDRKGTVDQVAIAFDNETAEETYARALALIDEWELTNHVRLDTWWAQAQGVTGPEAARVDTSEIGASRPGTFDEARIGGPDGPYIQLKILYSFDDDEPFFVQFEIYW